MDDAMRNTDQAVGKGYGENFERIFGKKRLPHGGEGEKGGGGVVFFRRSMVLVTDKAKANGKLIDLDGMPAPDPAKADAEYRRYCGKE